MINKASILLFGETGVGKSSLGNIILNEPNAFKISDKPESETKVTFGKFNDNKDIFVIDTPGCQDSQGNDKEHLDQMIEFIKSHNDLNAIILVFNYYENEEKEELNKANKTNLEIIKNIFKDIDIGKHVGIFFTHFYKNETDEKTKNEKEAKKKREINKIINSSENNFPCFYGNIMQGKEPKMETKVEIMRMDLRESEQKINILKEEIQKYINKCRKYIEIQDNINIEKEIEKQNEEKKKNYQNL